MAITIVSYYTEYLSLQMSQTPQVTRMEKTGEEVD